MSGRQVAAVAGRRRARAARRRLRDRVERIAEEVVLAPVEAELAAHADLCSAVYRIRHR